MSQPSVTQGSRQVDPGGRARTWVPSYRTLVGIAYGVCVVGMSLSIFAEMQSGYVGRGEQPRSLEEQLLGVVGFGTAGLLLSIGSVRFFGTSPQRAKTGAVLLGILSVPALAFFWCGMPALLGAAAARLAGLTRDGQPVSGAPRVFGIVGLVFALLNPVANFLAVSISWITSSL
ncbi:hypothetical protein [Nocardioides terrigena]|uniref:hypothetical protein n=1 Tax=Nocardioides terrigena TaxID=424797 RepID=UPI00131F3977|nr:hypothetical protein [Nocardioides terrigena]